MTHNARKTAKRNTHKTVMEVPSREKEPDYMVQIRDPKMLRKDLLESLREIIMFMQGYEKFRKIQEEKIAQFTLLRKKVKELNTLLDVRLRGHFPKGKLAATKEKHKDVKEQKPQAAPEQPMEVFAPVTPLQAPTPREVAPPRDELDELEAQLKEIENQLRNIK
ncbi:MAG: hypothetical protein AABX37_04705 [Nanoarchaeota archaeon]